MSETTSDPLNDFARAVGSLVRAAAGLVFVSVGAVALYLVASELTAWREIRGWAAVPAALLRTLDGMPRSQAVVLEVAVALAFGCAGLGLLRSARRRVKLHAEERALERRFPDQPWLWRPEWAGGSIPADRITPSAIAFAVLPNLLIMPAAFLACMQVLNGEIATFLLVLPMFAVGAGLAFSTTRAWLIQRRFSGTSLVLRQSPVELGGRLRGEIRVLTAVPVERELTVRLSCLRRYQDRGRKERVLWQTESTVPRHLCQLTPTSASIPIDVPAAADQPATSGRRDHHARILWRLDVFGACSGPDFAAHFEVPVFGRVSERAAADASASGQPSPAPRWPNARALGIKIERRPNGYTWIFRRRRTPLAVWIAAGTLFLTLSAAGLLLGGAVLGAIMFGVPAGVGIRWTLDLWLTEHRITLDPRNLTLGRSGYRPEVIVIPRTEIHAVKAARSTQLDSGQLYYDLLVESVARSYTVASMLESAVAARLADEVMSALRPPS